MPELPDIVVYIEALEKRILGQTLERVRLASPFLLRTVDPPLRAVEGQTVRELRRIGKRIAVGVDGDLWLVLHLMIAGRLHWRERGVKVSRPRGLAAFDFPNGSLLFTEAGSKKRASLHVVRGDAGLQKLDPGGLEVLDADLENFAAALTRENHTLKRSLTDPRTFSGIGNAYSDEILFEARLSPVALTQKLKPEEIQRLFEATRTTLLRWVDELRVRNRRQIPRKGYRVSPGYGGAWPLQGGVPAMRRTDSTNPVCGQRNQLLRQLPDRRKAAGRSRTLAADARRLAQDAGRTGSAYVEVAGLVA